MRQSSGEQGELLAEHKEDEKDSGRNQLFVHVGQGKQTF